MPGIKHFMITDRLRNISNYDQTSPTGDKENNYWESSLDAARKANSREHAMTASEALKLFPWAIIWSLVPSMAIVMEGYDSALINNFFAYPPFQVQFGQYYAGKGYQVSGPWQSALGAGGDIGALFGAWMNGYLINYWGFKKVFIFGQILMCAFIFVSFFGDSVGLQVAGQILCGIPWGIFATLGPAYSSELCPMALRPYLTGAVNLFFVIGQFIVAGVLQGLMNLGDQWSYRIPFAIQWVWPVPLLLLGCFMPESPWWHVRRGQYSEAVHIVNRLQSKPDPEMAQQSIAMMIHTNNMEKTTEQGSSYMDCFKGPNCRRTEIACMALAGQVLAGLPFAYSPTYFFEQAGLSASNSYKLGLAGAALAFIGTSLSALAMCYFGRRNMYVGGMGLLSACLLIIGCITPAATRSKAVLWAQPVLCLVWVFVYAMTIGPIAWVIPPEVSSTRLRSKTVVLARNTYYIVIVAAEVIEPYMLNPTSWNWRGFTGLFWFGMAFLTFIWSYFRLPETKGRTFEELDLMFAARIATKEFTHYKVDAYSEYNPRSNCDSHDEDDTQKSLGVRN
ncbi:general substrate transporter [Penicillium macrosclerotiorum]|uniref:general substrate transporter n=1 Tax=Penicillium macrosclerotiorum TaxID=303699 RepID=UPI0025468E9C|nr:general substrate transporter [Penicillium macrosclerotiorum]KAJ5669632.1 general substrate transporter [Penicillium macrosclerotiorum]